jgi:hypothetical protein
MNASAICESFNEPANWQFWGKPGARAIRHQGTDEAGRGYVHFIVTENGRESHRLAYGIQVQEAS